MQNDKKLIAEALLEIAKKSTTEFIEDSKIDKEIKDAAKKIGIELPSPDISIFKTVYAEIDKVNLNGVILPRKAVEDGLKTLISKQVNFEHEGAGRVCGYTIDAKINEDKIETINVFFKSLFFDQFDELKEKVKSGEAAVSFEIWNKDPETGESVVKELKNGFKEISPIIFHGTGLLLINSPACPKAKVFHLVANKEIQEAEKIVNKIFDENLIYASFAITDSKCKNCGICICGKEVKVIIKQIESKEWICPYCEKEIGEKELFLDEKTNKWYHRPCQEKGEIILPKETAKEKEEQKVELEKLYANVTKEEDITFEIAMTFYYSTEEEQKTLTEDAAKWTRKFINSLPDSAFAAIEPAYPEKLEDKNCRHLPHHNGEGDLGKDKSNANLDLPHYKNALARVSQIKPVSDSISAEDLINKASSHLERHKDVLEKSSEEPKTEVKPDETKPVDAGAETKPVETEVKKEIAQPLEVIEPKIVVKVTRSYTDVSVDTYVDGTPSGTSQGKTTSKIITEYKDGTQDVVESESEYKRKYDLAELEEAVNSAKAEKDTEIATLKAEQDKVLQEKDKEINTIKIELEQKSQEIEKAKVEDKKTDDLTVGTVEVKDNYQTKREGIDNRAFGKKK